MAAGQKLTVWLGDPDEDDSAEYYVHSEDSSVMVESLGEGPLSCEILIAPCLFGAIREVMDRIENRPERYR